MKLINHTDLIKENRKKRNSELLKRMKNGENLNTHDAYSSWFPPRPVIQKDKEAIDKLYHHEGDDHEGNEGSQLSLTNLKPIDKKPNP